MMPYRKYWALLAVVVVATFCLLGFMGHEVYKQAPPIPAQVKSADGKVLFTRDDIYADRAPGSRSAAWNWARSGGTAPTRRPTGRPIGCTAN